MNSIPPDYEHTANALIDNKAENFYKALLTCETKISSGVYNTILVSVSGGADSDVMLDLMERARSGRDFPIRYVFFDTGIEYEATKEHLQYLEERYGVQIRRVRAQKPVPLACKQYGQPFFSKNIAMFISRLQAHGFQWEDEPLGVLMERYPRCESALKWWCNANGAGSRFNIDKQFGLKRFMMENPPWFRISTDCCKYAKKNLAQGVIREAEKPVLNCAGTRKEEGGIRSLLYKNCFTPNATGGADDYRPLFFITGADREQYERIFGIKHSRCYTEYGLTRTGCAGCPFGSKFDDELAVMERYEPKLCNAVNNIFADSYRYTRMFREFKQQLKAGKSKTN